MNNNAIFLLPQAGEGARRADEGHQHQEDSHPSLCDPFSSKREKGVNVQVYGTGKPLLLFHGWGFDLHIWASLLPLLTHQYQLYLVDLPGFGLTAPMQWQDFKIELLKQLPPVFSIAGWSMGGLLATRFAIDEPQSVSHLINIASSPRFIREDNWPGVDSQIFQQFYRDLANNSQQTLQQFIELQQGSVLSTPSGNMSGLSKGLDILLNWDLREDLHQLNMPVLYLFGRLDAITPRKTMDVMQKMYPHINYHMFPRAAHAPFLSHPNQFISVLEDFIQ